MKKIISIFLLTLYSLAVTGASIRLHFCMHKFSNWNISLNGQHSNEFNTQQDETIKDCSCCKDEIYQIHTDQSYYHVHNIDSFQNSICIVPKLFHVTDDSIVYYSNKNKQKLFWQPPDETFSNKIYIQYNQWRI